MQEKDLWEQELKDATFSYRTMPMWMRRIEEKTRKIPTSITVETMSRDLIKMTESMFAKSHCHTFIFQFSDFIRPGRDAQEYEILDRVRVQEGVDTWDFYDEDLEPGMEGTVLGKGEKPFDYLVEFRLGSGMQAENFLQVNIDRDDLELVRRVG